ncbi:MAG: TrmH family RNA methyltransferase [Planctomycetota bacterium]
MSNYQSYLIIHNVSKDSNFGYLIRTANAMGSQIIMVGRKNFGKGGAVGQTRNTPVQHFLALQDAAAHVKKLGCDIVGIEIMPESNPIGSLPFTRSTAFMFGNEGEGLVKSQRKLCDSFVYVPQFGTAVSMNVNAATAIVLHRFAEWAGFQETARDGYQFRSGSR